ncbi:putative collagen-binding domain-containing protein [Paenibacillus sp.]|uniref:putative collagen-binding domain-containing protein n=1 Tax=Paenibacillus sp. TaxID=58172 RepID=UPI002D5A620A|nr:putative collagen-binding domain-containing protein [Paenibacillus sp.]HZG84091.1 putative collagen-binding domain-containing protein [Paenibacillus sp.]
MAAARADDHAYVYTPNGAPIAAKLGRLPGGRLTASWFDPRSGAAESIGRIENAGVRRFVPPSSGRGSDWVLVLEAGSCSES